MPRRDALVAAALSVTAFSLSARAQVGAHEGVTVSPAPTTTEHEGVVITPASPPPPATLPPPPPPPPTRPAVATVAPSPLIATAFGDRGTVVVVGGASFGLSVSPEHRSTLGHALDLGAAVEVFPFRRVSFGTAVSVAYDHYLDGEKTLGFGVTERVGYLLSITRRVRVWPRLGIAGSREVRERGLDPGHASSIAISAYVPFEIEPLPHLLIGLGPDGRFDLRERLDGASRPLGGRIGLTTEVVAWF